MIRTQEGGFGERPGTIFLSNYLVKRCLLESFVREFMCAARCRSNF